MRLFRGIDRINKSFYASYRRKENFKSEGAEGREVSCVQFVL